MTHPTNKRGLVYRWKEHGTLYALHTANCRAKAHRKKNSKPTKHSYWVLMIRKDDCRREKKYSIEPFRRKMAFSVFILVKKGQKRPFFVLFRIFRPLKVIILTFCILNHLLALKRRIFRVVERISTPKDTQDMKYLSVKMDKSGKGGTISFIKLEWILRFLGHSSLHM